MWKEALRSLDTGVLGQIGTVAFVVAFVLVVAYALTLSKGRREHLKNLPLDDAPPASPPADPTDAPR